MDNFRPLSLDPAQKLSDTRSPLCDMNVSSTSPSLPPLTHSGVPSRGLTRRFLVALGSLVLVGSVTLLAVLQWLEQRQGTQAFLRQAQTNAQFIEQMSLPLSGVLAGHLGTLTGWKVSFQDSLQGEAGSAPGVVELLAGGSRTVYFQVRNGLANSAVVRFEQPPEAWSTMLLRPGIWAALAAFMVLALAVGYWLARSLIRPLQSFAEALPQIGSDEEPELVAAERQDELGHVARTFLAARAQLRQERAKREQAERLATLGRMAASLAHEVRNPVAAIRMHAELISEEETEKSSETKASLGHITQESDKIENLVQQWTFFAKPEPPRTRRQDVRMIMQQVGLLLAPAAARARLQWEITPPDDALFAEVDATRLSQALTNVLQNAIHATPEHGTVSLQVKASEGYVKMLVTDSGAGFSEQALQHFAKPFFSEKEGGMGLGLTVASDLCAAHGGSLTVDNQTSGGALVTLQIPLA